jgi:heat shock protein HslJ
MVMATQRTPDRPTRTSRLQEPEVWFVLSTFAAAVVMTAIAALAVWISGGLPPRYFLGEPTWQWTGSTGGEAGTIEVAEPARYTIDFAGDRTFAAMADCNQAAGTYGVVPAGRAGGSANRLTIALGPVTAAACEPGSLSDSFLAQLGAAGFYRIEGSRLTITLSDGGEMTFEAASGPPGS